ncbi:hypothetical protein GGF37_002594 [Kickxella alabastrina]|nr:hypothetical protein GGF37_002594 [Kickxella alabastrina]
MGIHEKVDTSGITLPSGFDSLDKYASELDNAYQQYGYLARMHIVDFFVSDHWSSLPQEWQEYFDADDFEIASLINMASTGTLKATCPDFLRTYVNKMFALQFPREKVDLHSKSSQTEEEKQQILKYFLEGMSPKKQAEVTELSQLINDVAKASSCQRITDVGAGQGYLTRVLAYASGNSGAELLALDHDWKQARGAEKYQERILKRLKGPRARADGYQWDDTLAKRIVHDVQAIDMQSTGALEAVAKGGIPGSNYMVCGLHACGDLSSAVLKTFAESDLAAVVLVPCCYNHITENSDVHGAVSGKQLNQSEHCAQPGFPLSTKFPNVVFGTNALKAACQAAPRWEHDFEGTMEAFKRNYFRAMLHYLMVSIGGLSTDDKFPVIGSITNTLMENARQRIVGRLDDNAVDATDDNIEFAVYVEAALENINYTWRPTIAQCIDCCSQIRHGLKRMAAVWALRSMIGALIESILVVDRAAYLGENCGAGGSVRAFALFDPVTSPRNVVFVAQRKK